ncbi:MAG: type II toxin-antitoxin system RelE/ParE family toxin [Nostoc sp.]|uniref:type II toxin-antitoxin system RelE family toxin n=1 Tax=Nostoc sp. TaxID=1180 RepID=UPI002FF6347C
MDSDTEQPINTEYEIELTSLALEMLTDVKDKRHQKSLSERIDKLKTDPEKQGKPLIDKLRGYRSVRGVGQRYRIIYKVELEKVVVLVVGFGLRKEGDKGDIYTLLQRLLEE